MPTLSVITVVKDAEMDFAQTLRSVQMQQGSRFEYVVVDSSGDREAISSQVQDLPIEYFWKFSDQLEKVDKQLSTAKKSLEDLRSTRTNVMQRRLKDVGTLDTDESQAVLDMPSAPAVPSEE